MDHAFDRELPPGLVHVRTTDVFDNTSVPGGLLRAHRVAAGVWGRLVVHSGAVVFVFDDRPDERITVPAGDTLSIPPTEPHHLELEVPTTFSVEFHRVPTRVIDDDDVSTGLIPADDRPFEPDR